MNNPLSILTIALAGAALAGCQSKSYTSSLTLSGVDHQSDVSETVVETVDAHAESQAAFSRALELITQFTTPRPEVDMELYQELLDQVDRCANHVDGLGPRLERLEVDGETLFDSWSSELDQFAGSEMRERSERRMTEVQERFQVLLAQLRDTEEQMDEALVSLRDYVLFFNHNLNPTAVSSLRGENDGFADSVHAMTGEIESARYNANAFVTSLQGRTVMATQE